MLNVIIALFVFFFFLSLGCLLMFLETVSYVLLVPCLFYLLILRLLYQKANCIALEGKDLLICLFASLLFTGIYQQLRAEAAISDFTYLYLITFITTMMFVNTIRFKSLM